MNSWSFEAHRMIIDLLFTVRWTYIIIFQISNNLIVSVKRVLLSPLRDYLFTYHYFFELSAYLSTHL